MGVVDLTKRRSGGRTSARAINILLDQTMYTYNDTRE